ncbi:MAG: CPBP family intramembrane metalloprotease [Oscillospiraceae bacterium]|nr:CPBP family intramembrane metalloprotease [Oscillospiraceae bacterium]
MRNKSLPIGLTRPEFDWGTRYLLFQLVFLPSILSLLLSRLIPGFNSAHLNFAYFTVNFLAVVWIFRSFLARSLHQIRERSVKILLYALGGFAAYQVLTFAMNLLTAWLMPDFFNVNDASIAVTTTQSFWLMAIGVAVLAPVTEELFYRALLFGTLHRRSRLLAYTASVLVFASIHISGYIGYYAWDHLLLCFAQYIPAGLVLAWTYEQSGSIFAPIAIHIAVNTIGISSMR